MKTRGKDKTKGAQAKEEGSCRHAELCAARLSSCPLPPLPPSPLSHPCVRMRLSCVPHTAPRRRATLSYPHSRNISVTRSRDAPLPLEWRVPVMETVRSDPANTSTRSCSRWIVRRSVRTC